MVTAGGQSSLAGAGHSRPSVMLRSLSFVLKLIIRNGRTVDGSGRIQPSLQMLLMLPGGRLSSGHSGKQPLPLEEPSRI